MKRPLKDKYIAGSKMTYKNISLRAVKRSREVVLQQKGKKDRRYKDIYAIPVEDWEYLFKSIISS